MRAPAARRHTAPMTAPRIVPDEASTDAAGRTGRCVIVLPGRTFGPHTPQLFFPMLAAQRRGATVVALSWTDPETSRLLDGPARIDWVDRQVAPVLRGRDPGRALVVAKSLGTLAAVRSVSRRTPAIWVTPLLTDPAVVAALRRWEAPQLLVGGTADVLWHGPVARELTEHVLEIPDADHGLLVSGPLSASAHTIAMLADAAEAFLDGHVWTDRDAAT